MVERGTGRRAQILAVAAELFAKHGYHGVSIADLGAAVGVSGPALYRHFPSKEALLAEMLVGILTERDVLNAVAAADDPEAVSVEQLMTPDVVTVGPDWDLVEAARVMARRRIRHLVVYEGGQLLGVLSVRDVLPAVLPE